MLILFQFFELSTSGCWHQFNSNRNPQFRVQWRKLLVQITKFWYTRALRSPCGKLTLQLDRSALVCLVFSSLLCAHLLHLLFSALVQWDIIGISAPARETIFRGKGKCFQSQRGADLHREKSLSLVYNWLVLIHLDWSKRHSDWLVKMLMRI